MADGSSVLTPAAVADAGLDDWRQLFDVLHARFVTGGFATGLALVDAVGAAAEEADHHPDLDLRYGRVDVRLTSHDVGGVTERDVAMARTISELAAGVGATARPAAVQTLELALDTADHAAVAPFWAALLGWDVDGDEVADPDGGGPTIWFQQAEDATEVPSQRWHLDVRVPPEQAEQRVAAVVAAGGTLVDDDRAPAFWVLEDPQGNRACVTTWQGRD